MELIGDLLFDLPPGRVQWCPVILGTALLVALVICLLRG